MRVNLELGAENLAFILNGLVTVSMREITRMRLPRLYTSGVRYRRELRGQEDWQTAAQTYARGLGDCEDLAVYLCAERRLTGDPAARVVVRDIRPGLKHAVVRAGDGTILDPSRALGMIGRTT